MSADDEQALKELAIEMIEKGTESFEIAAALEVSNGTVAAWRAHLTRGTYDEGIHPRTRKKKPA
jgi:DNA-binding NarL/FixJ family response regulator